MNKEMNIKRLEESIAIINQAFLEIAHAQLNGPKWYTKGEDGLYQQVGMWVNRGFKAIDAAREAMKNIKQKPEDV